LNLVIDIGNTLQKIAVFHNDEMVYCQSFPVITESILTSIFNQFPVKYSIISSVDEVDTQVVDFLKNKTQWISYSHETEMPVTILYKTAETLGLDRIANAVGAAALFPNQNTLSIQAGTCLVFDFVNEKNEYLGGSISPGLQMRFEALHEKTKKLPLIKKPDCYPDFLGTDTNSSILCGVVRGMLYEMDGFINDYIAKYKKIKILLTGGDAGYLHKLLKNTTTHIPNLVLTGLNEIIKKNMDIRQKSRCVLKNP